MTIMQVIFLLVAVITLAAAMMVVSARRMMHAALWLVLTLVGVAVSYAILEASFFVVVQVMVYIGAIAIMIIFAVMLTQREKEDEGLRVNRGWWLSALVSAGLFALLITTLSGWNKFNTLPEVASGSQDLAKLGEALVDPVGYLIPFEVASVLLLAALIGSVYIALEKKGGQG